MAEVFTPPHGPEEQNGQVPHAGGPAVPASTDECECLTGKHPAGEHPAGDRRIGCSRADALWTDIPEPPDSDELSRLRGLLFAREIALIDKLRDALSSKYRDADTVSDVLAEAVILRSGKDRQLNTALEPLVDEILKNSLRRRQNEFVNVLFPLMGPSIRKSIAETFRSMLGSFSKSVEMAFSWRGLRWRLQGWRSGKPFSEIVMLNTLVYRVEQIFFIHSETGLVLSHQVNEGVGSHDADMVSAMLTAIQDFVRDCFASGSDGELESLQLGDFTIYIEKSPKAYLACVVRGAPPGDFKLHLRGTLELMLVEYAEQLEEFDGDTAHFQTAARFLDSCMLSHYADEDKPLPLWAKALPLALVLLAAGWFGFSHYQNIKLAGERAAFAQDMHDTLRILRAEPGLMIVHVDETSLPWQVIAFKDALARDPEAILRGHGIDVGRFAFKTVPFISYDASIVSRRAQTGLTLPDTVTMDFDGKGTLYLRGTAPLAWVVQARDQARTMPGVERVDTSGIHDPKMERIESLVREIEGTSIEFPSGKDIPVARDLPKLQKAVDALAELEQISNEMGFSTSLTIYGHADSTGLEKRNYEISQARTRTVAAMLYAKGSSIPIAMYGMGAAFPKGGQPETAAPGKAREDQASRRIELRVHLARSASAEADSILHYIQR